MNKTFLFAVLTLLALLAMWGCDNSTDNIVGNPGGGAGTTDKTCLGCHSSEDELQAALGDTSGSKFVRYDKGDG